MIVEIRFFVLQSDPSIRSFVCFPIFEICFWIITVSDFYQFNDLLTPEEQALRKKVRQCVEKEVAPIMTKVLFFILLISLKEMKHVYVL